MSIKLSKWPGYPGKITAEHQPDMRPESKGKYKLIGDWSFTVKDTSDGTEFKILINSKYISDGASVHRLVWTISGLTPDGLLRAAALGHDFLCAGRGITYCSVNYDLYDNRKIPLRISSTDSHRIFFDLMKAAGMGWRARLAYTFVRLFGPRW